MTGVTNEGLTCVLGSNSDTNFDNPLLEEKVIVLYSDPTDPKVIHFPRMDFRFGCGNFMSLYLSPSVVNPRAEVGIDFEQLET